MKAITPGKPQASPMRHSPLEQALLEKLAKLASILEEENLALRRSDLSNIGYLHARKSQSLSDLVSMQKWITGHPAPEIKAALLSIKHRLEENQKLLALHLKAAYDIASTLTYAISELESDGTYTSHRAQSRRRA